jgi:hypothetical protein
MADLFAPTHVIPTGGLAARAASDPAEPVVATLDPGLAVRLLERRDDGWAHVTCSNGWSAWVDGRRLGELTGPDARARADATLPSSTGPPTDAIATVASTAWSPTHHVPAAGLSAWRDPDPASAPAATLQPGLSVRLVEQRDDGWAHVACSNGWSAWVDGRALVGRDRATSTRAPKALVSWRFVTGAVLVVGGLVIVVLGLAGGP